VRPADSPSRALGRSHRRSPVSPWLGGLFAGAWVGLSSCDYRADEAKPPGTGSVSPGGASGAMATGGRAPTAGGGAGGGQDGEASASGSPAGAHTGGQNAGGSGPSGAGGEGGCGMTSGGEGGEGGVECAAGLTRCGRDCVDLARHPDHCGSCGHACSGDLVCSRGACHTVCLGSTRCGNLCTDTSIDLRHCGACDHACELGTFCVDGECKEGPSPEPRCQQTIALPLDTNEGFPREAAPSCTRSGGVGTMQFTMNDCATYKACDFAQSANLNLFDASQSRAAVLEVEFCVSKPVSGEINLWYGAFPARKLLALLRADESMEGCRTVRFAPEEAICHWNIWRDCRNGIDPCFTCQQQQRCNDCTLDFSTAKLTLIAERCQAPFGNLTVTLKAVRLVPKDCACRSDADCIGAPDRPDCALGLDSSICDAAGADVCGVCAEPAATCPRDGQACVLRISNRDCPGTIRCRGAASACEATEPACVAG
jgi:hypothetical protein